MNGWHSWMAEYPPDALIEVARNEWPDTALIYRRDMHPAANAFGLYWRLTGIGKEELSASVTLK